MKIFLSGQRGVGKSTIISRVLEDTRLNLGGFLTKAEESEVRMYSAADPDYSFVIGIRKQSGNTDAFNTLGAELLKDSSSAGLIVMDEIGWMESEAKLFSEEVLKILRSDKNVLGVLREGCKTPLTEAILNQSDVSVITVTESNREQIYKDIRAMLNKSL